MKFRFIEKNHSAFPVKKMCHALEVTSSGFYSWQKSPISKRKLENSQIEKRIPEIYNAHNGMAGSLLITANLRDEYAFSKVSRPRVARMMRSLGLRCKATKKSVVTTDSKHKQPVAPNLLDRKFAATAPNAVWVSDITYLKVGGKWYSLTVFIDLFSRAVAGWDLSESLEISSAICALNKAV